MRSSGAALIVECSGVLAPSFPGILLEPFNLDKWAMVLAPDEVASGLVGIRKASSDYISDFASVTLFLQLQVFRSLSRTQHSDLLLLKEV